MDESSASFAAEADHGENGLTAVNSFAFPSYRFLADSTSKRHRLQLTALNRHPESYQQALQQLHVAKQYITAHQKDEKKRQARIESSKPRLASNGERLPLRSGPVSDAAHELDHPLADNDHDDDYSFDISEVGDQSYRTAADAPPVPAIPMSAEEMTPEAYYRTPWWRLLLKRMPWLIILLLFQSFGALILNRYEDLLAQHLVLNFFIPMMQGTAGNAGNQPGVMVTRALSLGQLQLDRLLMKELPVCAITSLVLGVVSYFRIILEYPDDPGSALSIALAMFATTVVTIVLSILCSFILGKITCCDPADGAVPLLTTVSDIVGIFLLVAIAAKILPTERDQ